MKIDRRIIERFYKKDESAVNAVYTSTIRLLRHVAYDVLFDLDLSQDAALEAYTNLLYSSYRPASPDAFVSYLCSASKNAAISILRKRKEVGEFQEELLGGQEEKKDDGVLSALRDELGYPDYDILILHVVEGYSLKEIATYLSLGTASSVRGRYARAKAKARRLLEKEGY